MKELLLADAYQLSASRSKYESTRQQIERVEYETFTLREPDFDDLVFMEVNDAIWANNHRFGSFSVKIRRTSIRGHN